MTSNKTNNENNNESILLIVKLDDSIMQRPKALASKIDRSKTAPSEPFFVKNYLKLAHC